MPEVSLVVELKVRVDADEMDPVALEQQIAAERGAESPRARPGCVRGAGPDDQHPRFEVPPRGKMGGCHPRTHPPKRPVECSERTGQARRDS